MQLADFRQRYEVVSKAHASCQEQIAELQAQLQDCERKGEEDAWSRQELVVLKAQADDFKNKYQSIQQQHSLCEGLIATLHSQVARTTPQTLHHVYLTPDPSPDLPPAPQQDVGMPGAGRSQGVSSTSERALEVECIRSPIRSAFDAHARQHLYSASEHALTRQRRESARQVQACGGTDCTHILYSSSEHALTRPPIPAYLPVANGICRGTIAAANGLCAFAYEQQAMQAQVIGERLVALYCSLSQREVGATSSTISTAWRSLPARVVGGGGNTRSRKSAC